MIHRHLVTSAKIEEAESFTSAVIDDIIPRGRRQDWNLLSRAIKKYPSVRQKTKELTSEQIKNPITLEFHPQKYHTWFNFCNYVQKKRTS